MTCDLINGSAGVRSIGFGPLGTTWRLERMERLERLEGDGRSWPAVARPQMIRRGRT
jgi:hypothetical protein